MVVSHLTRMMKGYICAAGIDPVTREHVRPVLPGMRLRASMLASNGGPFRMAALVDLGETRYWVAAPEVGDVEFQVGRAGRGGDMAGEAFWELLESVWDDNLRDVLCAECERGRH